MENNIQTINEQPSNLTLQKRTFKDWCYDHFIKPFKKAGVSKSIIFAIVFILFAFYALTIIIPFLWMINNSFKNTIDYTQDKWSITFSAGFSNYIAAFKYQVSRTSIARMYLNSFIIVGGGVLVTLISCSLASYTVAKYKFRGRGLLYNVVIVAMMVPIVGTLPAQYRLINDMHLMNNPLGVWFLYSGGFGFNFLFLYSYFKGISWTYAEAAQLDGASHFKIFIRIMIPMAAPALTAIGVLTFMGLWGDYQTPYLYLNRMPTIALGLKDIQDQVKEKTWLYPQLLATAIVATLPILLLFCIFQKQIMNNLTMGGLKG